MKKIIYFTQIFMFLFISCKSSNYNEIMQKAKNYQWHNNMTEAQKTLKLTEKAIKNSPKVWDAYSLEIAVYSTWNHKSKDFSNNFEGLKSVYEKWINNKNELNTLQKLGYANTLYCLNDINNANILYSQIIEYYKNNKQFLQKNEREYVCYIISNIMLYNIDENVFNSIKLNLYDETGINTYLIREINNLETTNKKEFAERFCTS